MQISQVHTTTSKKKKVIGMSTNFVSQYNPPRYTREDLETMNTQPNTPVGLIPPARRAKASNVIQANATDDNKPYHHHLLLLLNRQ